jgi:hypothetical protein
LAEEHIGAQLTLIDVARAGGRFDSPGEVEPVVRCITR